MVYNTLRLLSSHSVLIRSTLLVVAASVASSGCLSRQGLELGTTGPNPNAPLQAPELVSVSPLSGPEGGGILLTLTGLNFRSDMVVTVGDTPCTNVILVSDALATCELPAHPAGSVDVVLSVGGVQSNVLVAGFAYNPAPRITSVTPATAGPFAPVTITGSNFQSGVIVRFDGSECTTLTIVDTSTIRCLTPNHVPGAVDIVITNADGQTATLTAGFTFDAGPGILSVSPELGALGGGQTITLDGVNFASGATVALGGRACTNVAVLSSTALTCTVPAGTSLGQVDVVVTNTDNRSGTLLYGYRYSGPPTISSVTPATGPEAGGVAVTISGENLWSEATVSFASLPCTTVITSDDGTSLSCTIPAHAAGLVDIGIVNIDGQSTTNIGAFTYIAAPTVTAVSPTVGGAGFALTLSGTGFVSTPTAPSVTLGGSACTSVVVLSATSLTCISGAHSPGLVDVVVQNNDGQQGALTDGYMYQAPPAITAVSPAHGPFAGGDTLTITGTGFLSGIAATIGGVACSTFTFVSSTQLTCVTPAVGSGPNSTSVGIQLTNPDTQSTTRTRAYTYYIPGTFDDTFNSVGGYAWTLPMFSYTAGLRDVTTLADGRIVAAGMWSADKTLPSRDMMLVRFLADGTFDPSFGGGTGIVRTNVSGDRDEAYALAVQSDGRIAVAGFTVGSTASGNFDVVIARYNADGSVADASRAINLGADSVARAMVLLPNDDIILVGCRASGRGDHTACDLALDLSSTVTSDIFVAKLSSSTLALDTSFGGGDGYDTYSGGATGREVARAVVLDVSGTTVNGIIAAGYSYISATSHFRSAVVRWTSTGVKDTTNYGATGARTFYHGGTESLPFGMVIESGLLVIADASYNVGCGKYYFGSMRLNATTGALDTNYRGTGYHEELAGDCVSGYNDAGRAVTMDPDTGNIVLAGNGVFNNGGSPWDFWMLGRYEWSDGTFDSTFYGGSIMRIYWGSPNWRCDKIAWQAIPGDSTGRILCAGWSGEGSSPNARTEESSDAYGLLLRSWP